MEKERGGIIWRYEAKNVYNLGSVAQLVERLCDKQRSWARILESVRFIYFFCCALSSMLSWQSVEKSNFDRG